MIRRPPRSTLSSSSAASDVYKRQDEDAFADDSFYEAQLAAHWVCDDCGMVNGTSRTVCVGCSKHCNKVGDEQGGSSSTSKKGGRSSSPKPTSSSPPSRRQLLESILAEEERGDDARNNNMRSAAVDLSLIHISEPTRLLSISYAVFCLKKKKKACNK
eukprot:TRINITY_DN10560_c0_g1_i1.p1 TRINITY_DN10560_c0_g1~~TRINITY_DN10560_c0_g1_i1.p1  ORF type:complete len:158 (+),score=46.48 TRINITY_DN10560_c0_g1_i1:60-533(+)